MGTQRTVNLRTGAVTEQAFTPEVITPASVTPRQAKLALLAEGKLAAAEAAIASIPNSIEREAAQIEWEYAQEFKIDHPLVLSIGAALGMSPEAIAALFRAADRL